MKKLSILLVALMLVSLVFAGCQQAEEPTDTEAPAKTEEKVEESTEEAPAAEPVTITVWEQMDPSAQDAFDMVAEGLHG